MQYKDELGNVYGKLKIIKKMPTLPGSQAEWLCLCECGNTTTRLGYHLRTGKIKSCGCLRGLRNKSEYLKSIKRVLKQHYNSYTARSKSKGLKFNIDIETFETLCRKNCAYCNKKPESKRWYYVDSDLSSKYVEDFLNGLDRIDSSKWYAPDNVIPCCKRCNIMKSDMDVNDFIKHIENIYNYQKDLTKQ